MSTPDPVAVDGVDHAVGDVVEVRTPADGVFVSTLRLTATSLGALCDLTVDDIEDLRLAVDEACALLLPHTRPQAVLCARFEVAPGRLTVDTSVPTSGPAQVETDGFSWTVLGALATTLTVSSTDTELTLSISKSRVVSQT